MKLPKRSADVAEAIAQTFARHEVQMTLGGEPTFLPVNPEGPEWTYSAVGPTKLGYARAMAKHLLKNDMKGGVDFFSPGKSYPGELNPRWAIRIIANRDGKPIFRPRRNAAPTARALAHFRESVKEALHVKNDWTPFNDSLQKKNRVWAMAVDAHKNGWKSFAWPKRKLELTTAEGPAGLRLPLHLLAKTATRRALTIEWLGNRVAIFMPPVLQGHFLALLQIIEHALREAGIGRVEMQGYLPPDESLSWIHLGLTADPGVLEVNLPACADWKEYDQWINVVTDTASAVGLRSWKQAPGGFPDGTGGGNHLLWGGPSIETNPFFSRPAWLASILRYWQKHPSLSYLFTGCYVGASSQAPRADESARDLYDLEMALRFLESLEPGDHRLLISETLRHLQTDVTGNSHRSEVSLDKFWNVGWPAGTLGLIEFRAIESLPDAAGMSSVALLWTALAAWLLDNPVGTRLVDHNRTLHDRFFLPSVLWNDLQQVLTDLKSGGFPLTDDVFASIWEWKFPKVLEFSDGECALTIRRSHESWPLLCETPVDGGTTSRFVDTSIRRLEFCANDAFAKNWTIRIANRPMAIREFQPGTHLAGLRYRETNLYPSLHPGLLPQMPLVISLLSETATHTFQLTSHHRLFRKRPNPPAIPPEPACQAGQRGDFTFDLRIR